MNTTGTQPELGLQDRPTTDVQRWFRLIPEHFIFIFEQNQWEKLTLEDLHEELKIHGGYPKAEDLITNILAVSGHYTDEANVRLGKVFLGTDWLPSKKPKVQLTPELFSRLESVFTQLGCIHLYDIWIAGKGGVFEVERDEDVITLWEYLYEYAHDVVKENAQQEDENEDEDGRNDINDMFESRLSALEQKQVADNTPQHIHHHTTRTQHISNNNRQGTSYWTMTFALVLTAILSGVAVKRSYINFGKIEHDIKRIIELVHPDELPKAIQVTPDQMRELEARDKQ